MKPHDNNIADALAWNVAYLIGYLRREVAPTDPKMKKALDVIENEAGYVERYGQHHHRANDMLGFAAKYIGLMLGEDGDDRDLLGIIQE